MSKRKILYVDDEPLNLEVFKLNFERQFEILIAESGPRGLTLMKENKDIQLVVSDMRMPEMNGIEFIKAAKAKYPNIAYFILTGFDITTEIQEALDAGLIYRYFSKPLDVDRMENSIVEVIGNKI